MSYCNEFIMINIWIDENFRNQASLFYHAFFCFFLIINLYFLIPAIIAQIFIPTAEFSKSKGTPINEVNTEIEKQPVRAELKLRKYFFLILNSN